MFCKILIISLKKHKTGRVTYFNIYQKHNETTNISMHG